MQIIRGDNRAVLKTFADAEAVDFVVTSPPYEEICDYHGKAAFHLNRARAPDDYLGTS